MEIYRKKKVPILRWVFAVLFSGIFIGLYFAMESGYSQPFDDAVRGFIYGLRADFLTTFFKGVTFMANPWTLTALCAIFLIIPFTTLRIGIPLSLVTLIGALAHKGLKLLIARERPDVLLFLIEESGYSFPSGHANSGLVFYTFLAFLISRALKPKHREDLTALIGTLFAILIFLIGVSRIYLGVHYPTDILAGWCLGGLLLIIFTSVYDAVYPMQYHLGYHTMEWGKEEDRRWARPGKPPTDPETEKDTQESEI